MGNARGAVELLQFVPMSVEFDSRRTRAFPGQQWLHGLDEAAATNADVVGTELDAHVADDAAVANEAQQKRALSVEGGYGLDEIGEHEVYISLVAATCQVCAALVPPARTPVTK